MSLSAITWHWSTPESFQEVFILKGREDKRLLPLIHALEAGGGITARFLVSKDVANESGQ